MVVWVAAIQFVLMIKVSDSVEEGKKQAIIITYEENQITCLIRSRQELPWIEKRWKRWKRRKRIQIMIMRLMIIVVDKLYLVVDSGSLCLTKTFVPRYSYFS